MDSVSRYLFPPDPNANLAARTRIKRIGGFPHSEIVGSKVAHTSPTLIAACHVLHRLSTPRHPSEALMRLIVLSKTHAWGRKVVVRRYETPADGPHMRFDLSLPDNDVFTRSILKLQGEPDKPFNSRCQRSHAAGEARRVESLNLPDRCGGVVEPDGFEPTTSCLQSTRSTN